MHSYSVWVEYAYWILYAITEPVTYLVVGGIIAAPLGYFLYKDNKAKKQREQELK